MSVCYRNQTLVLCICVPKAYRDSVGLVFLTSDPNINIDSLKIFFSRALSRTCYIHMMNGIGLYRHWEGFCEREKERSFISTTLSVYLHSVAPGYSGWGTQQQKES